MQDSKPFWERTALAVTRFRSPRANGTEGQAAGSKGCNTPCVLQRDSTEANSSTEHFAFKVLQPSSKLLRHNPGRFH